MASRVPEPPPGLRELVEIFGTRGVAGLEAVHGAQPPTDDWLRLLVKGVADPEACVPATWLLRAALEGGGELDRRTTAALLRSLAGLEDDDARLHVCQSVAHLEVPARNAEQLARFLRSGVEGDHKFTRAWAVDAFQHLARQHPSYGIEAARALERARRDPAASVRARARRIDAAGR